MKRVLLLVAIASLAGAPPATAQDEGRLGLPLDRERLPVLGTVGDLPPPEERVDAVLTAGSPPSLRVDGREVDLDGFKRLLLKRSDSDREKESPRASRLHAVLWVEPSVRWQDSQYLMQACADPRIRVHRVFFAAVPEDGGAVGAMATCLPLDTGWGPRQPLLRVALEVRKAGTEAPTETGRAVYAHMEKSFGGTKGEVVGALVDAKPWVSTGSVLRAVDALVRWGVRGFHFRGTPLGGSLGGTGASGGKVEPRPAIRIADEVVAEPLEGDPTPPPLSRVTGGVAGQSRSWSPPEAEPADVEEIGVGFGAGGLFSGRTGGHRSLRPEGGEGTEEAVEGGLDWLARHQSPEGHWDSDGFTAMCPGNRCTGTGGPHYDPGLTGLSLCAFLGYGETHKTPRYGAWVRNGLKYLKAIQDEEGCFGPRVSAHFTYNHALGTLAFVEAYGLTGSPLFESSAQAGVDFILACQNPYLAWRYGVRPGDNDTSTTAWMVTALYAAKSSGLQVDPAAFEGAKAWVDTVTDPKSGRTGYTARGNGPARPTEELDRFRTDRTESLTAAALWIRTLCGAGQDDPLVKQGVALCQRTPPRWDVERGYVDFYYWYYGTLAMFQHGGKEWRAWNLDLKKALVRGQIRDERDHRFGSWDPVDPWKTDGGRIYATALNTLTLETYYRYARLRGRK